MINQDKLKTPQGRTSLLTPDAYAFVRTDAFKNLFGDWESAMLIRQARNAWQNNETKYRFDFTPSATLAAGFFNLLGHSIVRVTITDDAIRHIKKNHAEKESNRGQLDMTPEDIGTIPYVMNNFDDIYEDSRHSYGPDERAMIITKRINGLTVVGSLEKGKNGAVVMTAWEYRRSGAPMLGLLSSPQVAPGPNVRNATDSMTKIKEIIETIKHSVENSTKILNEVGEPDVRFVVRIDDITATLRKGATRDEIAVLLRDGVVVIAGKTLKICDDRIVACDIRT
jgi:hypothetical protein